MPGNHAYEKKEESRPWPPLMLLKKGANTSDSTAISLIKMFSEGPEVSLRGSPTCVREHCVRWGGWSGRRQPHMLQHPTHCLAWANYGCRVYGFCHTNSSLTPTPSHSQPAQHAPQTHRVACHCRLVCVRTLGAQLARVLRVASLNVLRCDVVGSKAKLLGNQACACLSAMIHFPSEQTGSRAVLPPVCLLRLGPAA